MAKTIAVSDDVYELLRKSMFPGESYSDVIRRGLKRNLRLMDIAGSGTLSKEQWTTTQKVLRKADLKSLKPRNSKTRTPRNFVAEK